MRAGRIKGTVDVISSDMSDSKQGREGWIGRVQGWENRMMDRTGSGQEKRRMDRTGSGQGEEKDEQDGFRIGRKEKWIGRVQGWEKRKMDRTGSGQREEKE